MTEKDKAIRDGLARLRAECDKRRSLKTHYKLACKHSDKTKRGQELQLARNKERLSWAHLQDSATRVLEIAHELAALSEPATPAKEVTP